LSDDIFDFLLSIGMKPFVELSRLPPHAAAAITIDFKQRRTHK